MLIQGQFNKLIFTANLDKADGATMFFVIEQARETVLDFSQGAVKVLWVQSIV